MDNRPYREAVRAVIFSRDGKVCLCSKPFKGVTYYAFPGGGVEGSDSHETTVQKECLEEVGIVVTNVKSLNKSIQYDMVWPNPERAKMYRGGHDHYYSADFVRVDMKHFNSEGDGLKYDWYTVDQAINLIKSNEKTAISLNQIDVLKSVRSKNLSGFKAW